MPSKIQDRVKGRQDDLEILLSRGYDIKRAAEALGLTKDALWRWCRRWELVELYEKFPKPPRKPKGRYGGNQYGVYARRN